MNGSEKGVDFLSDMLKGLDTQSACDFHTGQARLAKSATTGLKPCSLPVRLEFALCEPTAHAEGAVHSGGLVLFRHRWTVKGAGSISPALPTHQVTARCSTTVNRHGRYCSGATTAEETERQRDTGSWTTLVGEKSWSSVLIDGGSATPSEEDEWVWWRHPPGPTLTKNCQLRGSDWRKLRLTGSGGSLAEDGAPDPQHEGRGLIGAPLVRDFVSAQDLRKWRQADPSMLSNRTACFGRRLEGQTRGSQGPVAAMCPVMKICPPRTCPGQALEQDPTQSCVGFAVAAESTATPDARPRRLCIVTTCIAPG